MADNSQGRIFFQLCFELFLSNSSINNIHLVDNLLLSLMFLSQLYQFIPQCYIFPEKESIIISTTCTGKSKLIALILSPSLQCSIGHLQFSTWSSTSFHPDPTCCSSCSQNCALRITAGCPILGAQLLKAFRIENLFKLPKGKSKMPVAPGIC